MNMNIRPRMRKGKDEPIIQSPFDTDFYKHSMGQVIFLNHRDVRVKFRLTCRTKGVKLASVLDLGQLREELEAARQNVRFGNTNLNYLRGTNVDNIRMFGEEYLRFLKGFHLPEYYIENFHGDLVLEFDGSWAESTHWEIPGLAIANQLYYETKMAGLTQFERELVWAEGQKRFAQKRDLLRQHPGLTFIDFGTRRRFDREWQRYQIAVATEELRGQFVGTSNIMMAEHFNTEARGTDAHERAMVLGGLARAKGLDAFVQSQHQVLREWESQYGLALSIALPDTFTSRFFYDHVMTLRQAWNWKGVRQDSGHPQAFFDRTHAFYKRWGLTDEEIAGKLFIASDGLTAPRMVEVFDYVGGRMRATFGWGTDLMNDLGFSPISIVVKPVEANGVGLVKLSDNPAKAIGKPEDIEETKQLIGYDEKKAEYEECVR